MLLPAQEPAHAQNEIKAIVETAAVAKRMRLVHQHANDVQFLGKLLRPPVVVGVNTA